MRSRLNRGERLGQVKTGGIRRIAVDQDFEGVAETISVGVGQKRIGGKSITAGDHLFAVFNRVVIGIS